MIFLFQKRRLKKNTISNVWTVAHYWCYISKMIVTLEAFMVWKHTIKGKNAKSWYFSHSKNLLHLWGEENLLKISSMKAFFHIPLLHSKHPVNNILQELINHQPHKKQKPTFYFLRIGQNWFLMIGQLSWVRLTEVIWSRHNLAVWRMKLFW